MTSRGVTKVPSVIEMERLDEEIVSPEEFLKFTPEQKHNILRVKPVVKSLELSDIDDPCFAGLQIKWKIPRYEVKW